MSLALPEFNLFGEPVSAPPPKTPTRQVFDAWVGHLNKTERAALAQGAKALLRAGYSLEQVLISVKQLSAEGAFPGLLQQRVRSAPEPCTNGTGSLHGLTSGQLEDCGCGKCRRYQQVRYGG